MLLLNVLFLGSVAAQEDRKFDYQEIVLGNGLRVISLEDFSCPIVCVQLWYHVGSKDEAPDRQGFAHMFEHMMFRGTDRLGSTDHFDFIRRTGGSCNAYTSFDQTVYHQTLPANQLNLALWLEAERMSMLKIDQAAFDTERRIVEEERRQGVNSPYGKVMEKALPLVFPDHPYRWAPIGSIPHLRSAAVPELRAFWTKYYVPNNATLVVVGAAAHAEVQQLAERNFGWIPRAADPPRIEAPKFKPFEKKDVTIKEKNAPAPLIGLVFRGVPLNHPDATALDLMSTILGGGESSRIYRRVVAEEQSGVMAMGQAASLEQDGMIAVVSVMSPIGGNAAKALKAMQEEVVKMQETHVTPLELEKARNQMLKGLVTESLTVESKAAALGSAAVLEGDVSRINDRLNRIRSVTADDIQRVAKTYLDLDHALTGRIQSNLLGALGSFVGIKDDVENAPITGKAETNPPPPGRPGVTRPKDRLKSSPVAGPLEFEDDTSYDTLTLDNGLRIIVVENREVPFVSAQLGLTAGAWTDTKPGTASMALGMLTKGTSTMSEAELAIEQETYGISIYGNAGIDSSSVSLGCLPERLDRGMQLLGDIVLNNTMPEEEFSKLKKQTRTGLLISSKDPSYIADREFKRRLYGKHPYARSVSGEVEDLDDLKLEDLRRWWMTYARPDMCTLVFAGDIDLAEAGTLAKKYLIAWQPQAEAPEIELPEIAPASDTHIYLVDNSSAQSQIRVGHVALTHRNPDYFAGRVVSGYFGGAFSSRLNETIRVEKGLTYGARGGFASLKRAGRFRVSTFSKTSTTVEAVEAILGEVDRLRDEPPNTDELGDTKSYFTGSYPATRETPQQVASAIWAQQILGLPDDHTQQLLAAVVRTTADECVKMAQAHVRPDKLTIVVVGPAAKLKEGLEKIAPVTVVSEMGVPVKPAPKKDVPEKEVKD
jgi:zinc protease